MIETSVESDQFYASNIRYGVWVRVAALPSGRWAVYHGTEAGGGLETGRIEIFESLDMEYLAALSHNEQAKLEERIEQLYLDVETKDAGKSVGAQIAKQGLEEMEL